MATVERTYDRGKRRGDRLRLLFGSEVRDARLALGLSQNLLGRAVKMPASKISRIERGRLPSLSFADAALIAGAVGLDLSIKTYPGGAPIRDVAQAKRLTRLLQYVARPLHRRTEVAFPAREGVPDQRSWDATIADANETMGVEVEMRIYDAQAQTRRVHLKWRDGGVSRLLLVIADTKGNRRALRDFGEYFADIPRLRTSEVLATLAAGRLPPTGMILL